LIDLIYAQAGQSGWMGVTAGWFKNRGLAFSRLLGEPEGGFTK